MQTDSYYTLGLDVGKAQDPTALAVIETDLSTTDVRLVSLHRFLLGTPYTDLLGQLKHRLTSPPLGGRVRLAVDATGLGGPFVDMFRNELPAIDLFAITITSGYTVRGNRRNPHVPKHDLIATTSLSFEQAHLRIAAEMRETQNLFDELLSYQHIHTDHGNDSYSSSAGQHDDLVLALSLALWLIEERPIHSYQSSYVDRGEIPGIVTMGEGILG
jgi:hypothetical protein